MRKTLFVLLMTFAAGAAQAQIQCWTGKDGRRACGDTPPPGAKVHEVRGPSAPPPAPPAAKDSKKDANKGPLTPAEQEQAFRKRQIEAEKAREKEEKERADAAAKQENCARAQEGLRALQSGQRIARTDQNGERYYLDDAQIAGENAKAQQMVSQWCK